MYSSLINTAIKITENPEIYEDKLNEFYKTDVTEKEKAQNFLNLIMEEPKDKEIFMERWKSVKDASVFKNNQKKGFAQNRFKREQFKNIADRVPERNMIEAKDNIKSLTTKNNYKEEQDEYDR